MIERWIYVSGLSVLAGIAFINPLFAQSRTTEKCVSFATGQHSVGSTWTERRSGVTYSCYCDRSQGMVCKPAPSFQSPSLPFGKGPGASRQMAAGLMGALFGAVFDFDEVYAPPDTAYQNALKQHQEEMKKQQEIKKQATERWLNLQAEEELKRRREEAQKKRKGEEIFAQAGIGKDLKMETIGAGELRPFSWEPAETFEAAPPGQYDTSGFTEMERLLCAAYFSRKAESAAQGGDFHGSRFYGTQMDNAMRGYPTASECRPPKEISTAADLKKVGELNQKYTQMAIVYREIVPKIERLHEIEVRLEEAAKNREAWDREISALARQIEEIDARRRSADTPEQKALAEDLLIQAMALESDAQKKWQAEVDLEEQLRQEMQGLENDLNAIQEKVRAGGRG